MTIHQSRLSNGVEVAIRESHTVDLVSIQCWVNVGSLDETPEQRGMSHLLEHMLFKGTAKRGVGEIAKTVETYGGDINAYTSFERTVYYLTLSPKYLEEGIEILADAIYNSAFDPAELAREKEVVLEEINRAYDDPSFLLGTSSFSRVFAGCEAERPIFGSKESVTAFSREAILEFYKYWYQPSNLTVVVVGDVQAKKVQSLVETHFGVKDNFAPIKKSAVGVRKQSGTSVEVLYGDYQQARLEFSFQGPNYLSEDSVHLDLCAYALGSGEASRLFRSIKEEKNLVSAIGCSCYTPSFSGVFNVSAFPMAEHILAATTEVADEICRFKYLEPVTQIELERARANTKSDHLYQEETIEGQARSLGFGLTTPYKHKYDDVYIATINSVSIADTAVAFKRWVDERHVMITAMLPENSSITKEQILEAYLKGVARIGAQPKPERVSKMVEAPVYREELIPGLTFSYRHIPTSQFFNACLVKAGGLRAETPLNAGVHNAVGTLLGRAHEECGYDELLDILERSGANLDGFSGKDTLGLRLHCLKEDTAKLTKHFFGVLFKPVFPELQWRSNKLEILDDLRTADDHPATVCYRELQNLVFRDHPYHLQLQGKVETVERFDVALLLKFFEEHRDQGPWSLSCVSSLPFDEVKSMVLDHVKSWRITTTKDVLSAENLAKSLPNAEEKVIQKKREQTHIAMGVKGLDWRDPDRYALELLSSVISGQGGRLFLKLRDRDSLAYTVTSFCSFGVHPGLFGAYLATAPDKAERAQQALIQEVFNLLEEPPTDEELVRVKNGLIGSHASEMQRAGSQAMNIALMELYGVGYDELLRYTSAVEAITTDDLMRVARRLLKKEHLVVVRVG